MSLGVKKGDVLGIARTAGIMGAKKTADLVPLCHPLMLTKVNIELEMESWSSSVLCTVTVRTTERTGVEMEALTAVSVAGLVIYDMCKAVDQSMAIETVRLEEKSGGRRGHFRRAT